MKMKRMGWMIVCAISLTFALAACGGAADDPAEPGGEQASELSKNIDDQDAYDPCEGLTCGDTCSQCAPDDEDCIEPAVVNYCQPDGSCGVTEPSCKETPPAYEPCKGLSCGDTCTLCPPDDEDCQETAVVKYCQRDGSCGMTEPMCK